MQIKKSDELKLKIEEIQKQIQDKLVNFTQQKLEVIKNQFESIQNFQIENQIYEQPKVYYDFKKLDIKEVQSSEEEEKQISLESHSNQLYSSEIIKEKDTLKKV